MAYGNSSIDHWSDIYWFYKVAKELAKSTFHICQCVVLDAIHWLIENNPHYIGYEVDGDVLAMLPEDDVPVEILAAVCQEEDVSIIDAERDAYVPEEDLPIPEWNVNGVFQCSIQNSQN